MNHKRRKPKSKRAGRLFCKPWKDERWPKTEKNKASVQRRLQKDGDE